MRNVPVYVVMSCGVYAYSEEYGARNAWRAVREHDRRAAVAVYQRDAFGYAIHIASYQWRGGAWRRTFKRAPVPY